MAVDPADSRSKVVVGHVFLDPHAATARQDGGGGSRPAPPLTPDTASADDWSAVGSSSSDDGLDARAVPADAAGSGGRDGPAAPPLPLRRCRMSIQVTLEETGKCGRYRLKSDDSDLLEILRKGVDQEQASMVTTAGQAPAPKAKVRIRDLVFTRRFTTFDRQNPLTAESPFHGFFTLFWLMCAALLIRVAANNQRAHGSVFGGNELMHMMFDRDVIVMGITDGVMCAGTAFGLLLQKLILKGYLTWNKSGWILQHAWQACYLAAVVGWTFYRDWPWTHTCFIVLHAMVFLMKQHSYSSYNGYLSQVYRRKLLLQEKLGQLADIEPVASPVAAATTPDDALSTATAASATDGTHLHGGLRQRRESASAKSSTNLRNGATRMSKIASAIESGQALDAEQMHAFEAIITAEIGSLEEELDGKSTSGASGYPRNLTLANFADWTCLPTLVYELEYPRQDSINWWYVAEKTGATFGVIWVMMVISQAFIYPPVAKTVRMKEAGMTLHERWKEFPWIMSDMLFPLLLEQLLSWYVIWECLLNVLAEVTRFADRGFYGDWWNSVSWDQYARDWNRPVHGFLLRHVYHSSISAFHLSKTSATFVTFLLSGLVHELIMFCLFKKLRGYLFAMQLTQLPLAAMSRTKLLKGRNLLGNVIFWIGLFVGPSLLTSLYLIV